MTLGSRRAPPGTRPDGRAESAPFTRYTLRPILVASWSLRHDLALRDALYVALARRLEAPLVTADARLTQAPDLGVGVILVQP